MAAVALMTAMCLSSCSKENSSLTGLWRTTPEYSQLFNCRFADAIEFVGGSTMKVYNGMCDTPSIIASPSLLKDGWYYSGSPKVYSYVMTDGMIVRSDGTIYSYTGGKIYLSGSSEAYSKW